MASRYHCVSLRSIMRVSGRVGRQRVEVGAASLRHSGAAEQSPEPMNTGSSEQGGTVPPYPDRLVFMGSGLACGAPEWRWRASYPPRWRDQSPDRDGALDRIERDPVRLAVEREAAAVQQVLRLDGGVVGQAELPQGDLIDGLLPVLRIEIDEHENAVVPRRRQLGVGEDVVVPGVQEQHVAEVPQRRIAPADAVELADVVLNVAGPVEVPGLQLVFLRVEVFLLAGHGRALAD